MVCGVSLTRYIRNRIENNNVGTYYKTDAAKAVIFLEY